MWVMLHHTSPLSVNDPYITIISNTNLPYITIANSGWDLNFGLLNSICMEDTIVIYDELVHNSLLMGIRASKHQMAVKFRHNDVDALKLVLESCQGSSNIIVIVESIYSMDGGRYRYS